MARIEIILPAALVPVVLAALETHGAARVPPPAAPGEGTPLLIFTVPVEQIEAAVRAAITAARAEPGGAIGMVLTVTPDAVASHK